MAEYTHNGIFMAGMPITFHESFTSKLPLHLEKLLGT